MSTTDSLRPRVADLAFGLFARPPHPELFDAMVSAAYRRGDDDLLVRLTPGGHAVTWRSPAWVLTEVVSAAGEMPERHRLLGHAVRGERTARHDAGRGVRYQVSTQVEVLPPEVYRRVHDEILADGLRRGVLYNFRPRNRLALAPLGLVVADACAGAGAVAVAAFHTFPDERAVVKTQSLIERPGG